MSLNRRKERECVFEMLFACEFGPAMTAEEEYDTFMEDPDFDEPEALRASEYIKKTFFGAHEMAEKSEELLLESAVGWKKDRISKASMAIVKLASYEINAGEIPVNVAINEAVELSKKYDDEKVSAFVNAVLGKIAARLVAPAGENE